MKGRERKWPFPRGLVTDRRPHEPQNLPVVTTAPHAQPSSSFHRHPPGVPTEMAPGRTMLAGKCRRGFALMLVVHVYSRELPILPGPWEDTVASPCLTRPGPRVSRAVSHWAHCFSRSTGSTLSLPPDRKPHPSQLCSVHGAGAAASKGGITRTLISYCQ